MGKRYMPDLLDAGIFAIMALWLAIVLSGCATSKLYDADGRILYSVESHGFFRDGEAEITKPDGTRIRISSKSTTSEIMRAGNELIGTAAGIAGQLP